jgi:hypothetical protein
MTIEQVKSSLIELLYNLECSKDLAMDNWCGCASAPYTKEYLEYCSALASVDATQVAYDLLCEVV